MSCGLALCWVKAPTMLYLSHLHWDVPLHKTHRALSCGSLFGWLAPALGAKNLYSSSALYITHLLIISLLLLEAQLSHFPTPQFLTKAKIQTLLCGLCILGRKLHYSKLHSWFTREKERNFLQRGNVTKAVGCPRQFSWHCWRNIQWLINLIYFKARFSRIVLPRL